MSNEQSFLDHRVYQTKKNIKKSFLSLLQGADLDDITVTRIVAKSQISRATFYNHYNSKEELLRSIIDENIKGFIKSYREPYEKFNRFSIEQVKPASVKLFEHVYENSDFYTAIANSDLCPYFYSRLSSEIKELGMRDYTLYHPKINNDVFATFMASAITGLIVDWVKEGIKYSPQYMAEQLMEIVMLSANHQLEKSRGE